MPRLSSEAQSVDALRVQRGLKLHSLTSVTAPSLNLWRRAPAFHYIPLLEVGDCRVECMAGTPLSLLGSCSFL